MGNENYFIGIDFGATKTSGILAAGDNVVKEIKIPTPPNYIENSVSAHLSHIIDELMSECGGAVNNLKGIGVGVPGTVDHKQGVILKCPNTPIEENLPIRKIINEKYHVPVFIENDANAAAIGEKYFGEGINTSNFICLTLGTGIGGGIFINGEIYRGFSGSAGEVGHMIINKGGPKCGCGTKGCLEALSSGLALKKLAQNYVVNHPKSLLSELVSGQVDKMKGEYVTRAAQQGDIDAKKMLKQIGQNLGFGLITLVNILNPEKIILTGSLTDVGDLIINPAKEILNKHSYFINSRVVDLVISKLRNKAGVLGATALVLYELSVSKSIS